MKKETLMADDIKALNSMATEYHEKLKGGKEDEALLNEIKKKSELIAYMVPYQDYFLPREECAEFFFYFKPCIEKTIKEYHIAVGTIPYVNFLIQRIKFRVKTFQQKKRQREKRAELVTLNEEIREKENSYSIDNPELSQYETRNQQIDVRNYKEEPKLNELLKKVASSPHNSKKHYTPEKKEALHSYLSTSRKRENFLLFLLTTLDSIDTRTQTHLADVFDVDEFYFAEISRWIHENGRNYSLKKRDDEKQIEGKIWARYVCIDNSLELESQPSKVKELEFQKKLCREKLTRLRKKVNRHRTGLSYREIAKETGISLSKVAYTIKGQRTMFENIEKAK